MFILTPLCSSETNIINIERGGRTTRHTGWGVVVGLNNYCLCCRHCILIGIGGYQTKALDASTGGRIFPPAGHEDILNDTLLDKFARAGSKEAAVGLGRTGETLQTVSERVDDAKQNTDDCDKHIIRGVHQILGCLE